MLSSTLFALAVSFSTVSAASYNQFLKRADGGNVTVEGNSSDITYSSNFKPAPICKFGPDGKLLANQPGCLNVLNNCTTGDVHFAQVKSTESASANFTFTGTGIVVNGLSSKFTGIADITIDDQPPASVDTFDPSGAFVCKPLFSKSGLSDGKHTISIVTKAVSPQLNDTDGGDTFQLTIVDFVVLKGDSTSNSSNNNTSQKPAPGAAPIGAAIPGYLAALFVGVTGLSLMI